MTFLEDLKKSDEYIQLILENVRDLITILNDKYEYEYINERAHREILGYDKSDLIGKRFWEFIHREDYKCIIETNTFLMKSFKEIRGIDKGELRIRHKNGNYVWIEYTCKILIDDKDRFKALLISRDISMQKESEEILTEREKKFHSILESLPIATLLYQNYECIYANHAAEKLTGYSIDELKAKKFYEFVPPDYKNSIIKIGKALENNEKYELEEEIKIVNKSGSEIWIKGRIEFIEYEGRHSALLALIDITDLKNTAYELKESEEKVRTIMDRALMGIGIFQNNEIKYCNQKLSDIIGYSIEELKKKNAAELFEIIHPEDRQKAVEHLLKREKGEKEVKNWYNYRTVKKTGEFVWIEELSTMINYGGRPANIAMILDITEKKDAEIKLRESEEKFRSISEESLVGIGIIQDGLVKYVNQQASNIFEYTIEEMMGWSALEFIKGMYPEDQKMEIGLIERVLTDPKTNKIQYRARGVKKSGRIFWADVSIKKIEYGNRPAFLGNFIDVTDRKEAEERLKESEERYRLISENSGDVVWTSDMNFKINYVSPNSPKILGYSVEEVRTLPTETRITPTSMKLMIDILKEELKEERKKEKNLTRSCTFETEQIHKNGSIIPIEMTITFLRDGDRKAIGVLGVSRNITERKKVEQKLRESEEKFRNAFKRANFYKDLLAHDFSNILASILLALELNELYLNDPTSLNQIKELFKLQKEAITKGTNLISSVRKLDEIEKAEIFTIPINLCEVLKKSINFVKNAFPLKNIKFNIKSLETDVKVNANELLEDVFVNLMMNSVKYNENDPIEIQVKISKQHIQKDNLVKVEFIDNGIGVSDDKKKIVFQGELEHEKGLRETGHGLLLVKKILDRCNGFISVENRVKEDYTKGSNFIVLLPESI